MAYAFDMASDEESSRSSSKLRERKSSDNEYYGGSGGLLMDKLEMEVAEAVRGLSLDRLAALTGFRTMYRDAEVLDVALAPGSLDVRGETFSGRADMRLSVPFAGFRHRPNTHTAMIALPMNFVGVVQNGKAQVSSAVFGSPGVFA